MKPLLTLVSCLLLTACVGFDNSNYKIGTKKYDDSNSGVILFRSINTNTKDQISGFGIMFKNLESGEYVRNHSGLSGYPNETFHALRVPTGTYILNYFFIYDGQMESTNDPFSFKVTPGKTKYIGSAIKYWTLNKNQLPKNITEIRLKEYKETTLIGKGFTSQLMVANEGENILKSFKDKYPEISSKHITIQIMD